MDVTTRLGGLLLEYPVSPPCLLLELPLEIRLRIYTVYFASEPLWISKHQNREPSDDPGEYIKHISCRIFSKSYKFLATCKQVYAEGKPLMLTESCYDFARHANYKSLVRPVDVPEAYLASIKSLTCHTRYAFCWMDSKQNLQYLARNHPSKVNALQHVTLIDDSLFLFALMQGRDWGRARLFIQELLAESHIQKKDIDTYSYGNEVYMGQAMRLNYLRATVFHLQNSGVQTVSIRSSKLLLQGREVFLSFGRHINAEDTHITVYGLYEVWEQTAESRILSTFSLDTAFTKFTFVPKRKRSKAVERCQKLVNDKIVSRSNWSGLSHYSIRN